jgi:diguanylate cyclase (GGDEF)-like protein
VGPPLSEGTAGAKPPAGRGALAEGVSRLIAAAEGLGGRFSEHVEPLVRDHGVEVYSELLHQLVHLRFEPEEAREHWERIVYQQRVMQEQLTSVVDVRVSLINYFTSVNRVLRNPKIIESDLLDAAGDDSRIDHASGLYGPRFLADFLDAEIARSRQYNAPVSLLMIEIDDLESIRSAVGVSAGGTAFRAVASRLRRCVRSVDLAASCGDGRFALVLPSTPKANAVCVGERALDDIGEHVATRSDRTGARPVSVRVGIATCPADGIEVADLIGHAEAALAEAGSAEHERVALYGNSMRSYRRTRVVLPGRFRSNGAAMEPLTTVNVSTGGMLFRADRRPPQGAMLRCGLDVPGTENEIELLANVVYSGTTPQGYIEIGTRFLEMSAPDRWLLSQFLEELELRGDLASYQEAAPDDEA